MLGAEAIIEAHEIDFFVYRILILFYGLVRELDTVVADELLVLLDVVPFFVRVHYYALQGKCQWSKIFNLRLVLRQRGLIERIPDGRLHLHQINTSGRNRIKWLVVQLTLPHLLTLVPLRETGDLKEFEPAPFPLAQHLLDLIVR